MEYIILFLERGKSALLGKILQDDLVNRQTIAVREPSGIGMPGEGIYLLIEGTDAALKKAVEIAGPEGKLVEGKDKEDIHKRIKEAEENVAEGLGLMFG